MTQPAVSDAGGRAPAIIRAAFLAGVLLFGGTTWFVHHYAPASVADAPRAVAILRFAIVPVWMAALGATVVLRRIRRGTHDPARRAALLIVGWAIAEGVALLGGVHWFLSGEPTFWVAGILFYLASAWVLLPIAPPA